MTISLIVLPDDADQAMEVVPTGTDMESDSSGDSDGETVTNDDSQKQTTNMPHLTLHQVMTSNVLVVIIRIQFTCTDHMLAYVRYCADNATVAKNICTYFS